MKRNIPFIGNLIFCLVLTVTLSNCSSKHWKTASRKSSGIARPASDFKPAVFQIFIARAFSWRGVFATHPWIAWKNENEDFYQVAQIVGWRIRRGLPALEIKKDIPDRYWFDSKPEVVFDLTGEKATKVIEQLKHLLKTYPHRDRYVLWPGPNSNTFVDYIIRSIPEIKVELPPHSIGKDYLGDYSFIAKSPGGRGVQVSLWGVFGLTLGLDEGIELNIFSLNFGLDLLRPALKLPFIGRLGLSDK